MNISSTRTAEQMEIANLKLEVMVLREFVRALYALEHTRDPKAFEDTMIKADKAANKGQNPRSPDASVINHFVRQFGQKILAG